MDLALTTLPNATVVERVAILTAVRDLEIRNPAGRWGQWLSFAVAGLLGMIWWMSAMSDATCGEGNQPCGFGARIVMPFLVAGSVTAIFGLATWVSIRARVFLTPAGLRIKAIGDNVLLPWDEIVGVSDVTEIQRTNGMRTGTERSVEIVMRGGRRRELPVPKAGRFVGAEEYDHSATAIWQYWMKVTGRDR
jgi:hypothetical protein